MIIVVTGQPGEGPMGISVALSPATATPTVSKSMITNASFRTKKLPGEYTIDLSSSYHYGTGCKKYIYLFIYNELVLIYSKLIINKLI